MANTLFLKLIGGMGLIGLTLSATCVFAEGASKDNWINSLQNLAPRVICESFTHDANLGKRLKAANISYEKCLVLIPASFKKCRTKYYAQIPATIKRADADKWGNNMGACIGGDFTMNHLLTPKS